MFHLLMAAVAITVTQFVEKTLYVLYDCINLVYASLF